MYNVGGTVYASGSHSGRPGTVAPISGPYSDENNQANRDLGHVKDKVRLPRTEEERSSTEARKAPPDRNGAFEALFLENRAICPRCEVDEEEKRRDAEEEVVPVKRRG